MERNAREIKDYVEEIYWGSGKRVLILGHSKGGVDAAAALSLYWSDLREKVAGLALAQSPYGGSPIASDILREGQLGDYVNVRKLMEILICKVMKVCIGKLFFKILSYIYCELKLQLTLQVDVFKKTSSLSGNAYASYLCVCVSWALYIIKLVSRSLSVASRSCFLA